MVSCSPTVKFKAKMHNSCWFQLLKCDNLLSCMKYNLVLACSLEKKGHLKMPHWFLENCDGNFIQFYDSL